MGGAEDRRVFIDQVRDFVRKIEAYRIQQVVLFGSRIRGDALVHSDLDVILVSDDFEGISFPERPSEIYRWYDQWKAPYPLEVLCYTWEEFRRKRRQIGLVRDAVEEGIVVDMGGDWGLGSWEW